ncbi:mechanosensitive ion channel family protein [Haloferacaceae archaeon DSL9]
MDRGVLAQVDSDAAAQDFLREYVPSWLQFPGYRLFLALLVVACGIYASKLVVQALGRPVARRFERQSVAQIVLGFARGFTILFSILVAGSVVGLGVSNLVLSVTVFSAVVGIILAPIVGNVINGLFVLADQPYEIGDMIQLDDGTLGFVEDITIRYTKVFTLDNTFLVIPNGSIRERDVENYSAEDERTRTDIEVLVTYESDIKQAIALMERAAREHGEVIKGGPDIRIGTGRYPAGPRCMIAEYGDNGILLRVRFWIRRPYKLPSTRGAIRSRIGELFADADVEMAYPHQHLVFDETSGEAQIVVRSGEDDVLPAEREHSVADGGEDAASDDVARR